MSPTQPHAAFTAAVVDGGELKTIEGATPRVLINVVSARHAAPDNLLDCSIFEDDYRGGAGKDTTHQLRLD